MIAAVGAGLYRRKTCDNHSLAKPETIANLGEDPPCLDILLN